MPSAKELLGDLAPKDKEQEKIFNEAVDRLLDNISKQKEQMASGIYKNTNGIYLANAKLKSKSDGFSRDREYRQIATIPLEVAERIKQKHGKEVMDPKNGEMLKKVLRTDPEFEGCLTVDRRTI
jgi:citrate synthase